MNLPAVVHVSIPSLAMDEAELVKVLESSIYPGAKMESIKLVVAYCKAQQLDPLQKPVHIVPMDVKTGQKDDRGFDITEKRDVIMPGVGLYRTQAARTKQYMGISEPVYGPTQALTFREKYWENNKQQYRDAEMPYPEWCRITVRRRIGNTVAEFTAVEYWAENYATAGKGTNAPNAMWKKRPYAQLAKCAEAQALRKAFPEQTGAQPTADEMEGKMSLDEGPVYEGPATVETRPVIEQPRAKSAPKDPPQTAGAGTAPATADDGPGAGQGKPTPPPAEDKPLTEGQMRIIRAKLGQAALTDIDLVAKFGAIEDLKFSQFAAITAWIANPAG